MDRGHYRAATGDLRAELKAGLDADVLRALHRRRAWRHFLVLARQLGLAALSVWLILAFPQWWAWLAAAALLGLVLFDCTVLLHEVVHDAVFARRRPFWSGLLGRLYALPAGVSSTQFTRWHLDHHRELGTSDEDPKRRHLTPKIVRRWYKALYCTPVLFFIYFRAAAREGRAYPPEIRGRIGRERNLTIALHLGLLAALWFGAGPLLAVKLYVVPVFVFFPVWFTLNRIGQHYDVHPGDPTAWSTVMRPSLVWDFLFLNSNYHAEHHFFPSVPMYNLPALHRLLRPVYAAHGIETRTYPWLLWKWFVQNRAPHTDWQEGP